MNSNGKNLKVDNDAKNRNALESITKESTRRSGIPHHKSHPADAKDKSEVGDKKIGPGVSRVTTKGESLISAIKNQQIHESERRCPEQLKKPVSNTVRNPSSPPRQETKYSRALDSREKSTALNSCKRQPALKSKKGTGNDDSRSSNRKPSLRRAKEAPCAIIEPSVQRDPRRELKYRDSEGRRGAGVKPISRETEKVDKKPGVHDLKKCPVKIDENEKIKTVSKQIKNNLNNSEGIVDVKRTQNRETSPSDNGIDTEATTISGAARTRIFKYTERTRAKDYSNKVEATKSSPVKEQIDGEQESIKTINLTNCTIRDEKMLRHHQGVFKTAGSCSDCNPSKEFGMPLENSEATGGKNDLNSAANSIEESCKQEFPRNIEIDYQPYVSDDSAKRLNDYSNEIGESSTVAGILQSDHQDKITTHAHSADYEHHSDQQSSRRSNQQAIEKYLDDTTSVFPNPDNSPSAVNDDEKYNLMKVLINSPIENELKGDNNDRSRSLLPNHGSDSVITSKGNEFRSCCTISSSIADVSEKTSSLASSTKPSESHCNDPENCESWNPHASEVCLKQPISNTSDCISINSKIRGCKHAKKYRHFKYEEENMCCSVARYVKQMVADERRHQEIGGRETPEREELKIIIDENSTKTSKIRIVNDRSSVSVVCHSLERLGSPGRNNTAATKKESSGGESSGYKSFHNDSTTKTEGSNKLEHTAMMSHDPKNIYVQYHNPSVRPKTPAEILCNKPTTLSSDNNFNSLYVDDPVNANYAEHLGKQDSAYGETHKRQNLEVKYKSYGTKDYLSTFTNCMEVYLPCEITAYQVEERKESGIYKLNNNERLEKDVDDAELNFGKYLEEKKSYSQDDISDDDKVSGSSRQLDSEDDFDTPGDKVLIMKKPDNQEYQSQELIGSKQLGDPHSPNDSTNIPAVSAHHKIVTSPLNIMARSKTSDPSDTSTSVSQAEYSGVDDISVTNVKSSNVGIQTNGSNQALRPLQQEPTEDNTKEPRPQETRGKQKNKREEMDDSNAVRELWTNKKPNTESTDDDSQVSRKSHGSKKDRRKHGTNRFKFNVFKKPKLSASEKTVEIPIDQLPKPPSAVLENSAPSNSTVIVSTVNSDPSRSTFAEKSQISTSSIRRESSLLKLSTGTATMQQSGITQTDAVSKEDITQTNSPSLIAHQDTGTYPRPSGVPKVETLLPMPQGINSAVPPPASALPPPYPFCCPMAPYMMQYWQNNQQPPPPEANWHPTSNLVHSAPPPPGMVPIPWFPPMMHYGNPALSMGPNTEISDNLRAQPPARDSTMSRSYPPCLPCSKTPESHLRHTDSMSYDGDEPLPDSSDKKQDVKKKKVSKKLFNIFRRRDRPDADTTSEEDKQGKYRRARPEPKSNNVQVAAEVEQNLEDHSIWDSPDIAGIVTPEEIGRCFRRGFRADGLTLSGDNYVCAREPSDTTSEHEDIFNFSDHDTPLDFLLALGFSVDEATAAIRDDDVRSRFKAALTEARIWVPHIATTQGTLLYLLAMKAKPKVMRYFLQLVESIVNKRITNAVKLDAYLKILEKVEEGYVSFVTLFGKDSRKDDEEDTVIVEKQRRRIFYTIYRYAEAEAQAVDRPLTKASVDLLHSLAARYRSAIGPHLRLLASYIGEGLLTKDVQLEAALIYLSRLDSADVKLADLEKYCGLPSSERRRLERIEPTESAGN